MKTFHFLSSQEPGEPVPVSGCLTGAQSSQVFHLVGAAEFVDGRLRLTPAERQTAGAAWFAERQFVAGGFQLVFRFQLTGQGRLGPGADGLAFAVQNHGIEAERDPDVGARRNRDG